MVLQSSLKSGKQGADYEGSDVEDYEVLGTSTGTSSDKQLWVDPDVLRLRHRIGRGPFGDVWLATIHSSTKEFDEFHTVAVKMLPADTLDHMQSILQRFQTTYQGAKAVKGVSWPQGITIVKEKKRPCIIMKYFEGSIGDKMAHLPSNKLPLEDVLRYGQNLLRGISELHSQGVIALNLKPCNFLLDDQDVAVLGEFGIPMLYTGTAAPSEQTIWLGSPNYMAPEQWGANVRGPVSFETDCWGFACSMIELLTGEKPWRNLTPQEIFKAVVESREKPSVPTGLPHSLERVLKRCFAYDYRHRPSVNEILQTFINPNEPFKVGDWVFAGEKSLGMVKSVPGPDNIKVQFCDKLTEMTQFTQFDKLSLWKDPFQVGDPVRLKLSVTTPRFGWPGGNATEGTISEMNSDDAVFIITFVGSQQTWRADPLQLERVRGGLVVNDWVRSRRSSSEAFLSHVGIVHEIDHVGKLKVAFLGRDTLFTGEASDFEKAASLQVGQYVRLKQEVVAPRFKWPLGECGEWDTGRIAQVLPNGGLVVDFPGRLFNAKGWWADPEEVEVVRINEIEGLLKKYQHVEKMHWAVRPAVSLLGLLVAVRTGVVVVNLVTRPFRGKKLDPATAADVEVAQVKHSELVAGDKTRKPDGSNVWLPSQVAAATSTVAGIMFGDR